MNEDTITDARIRRGAGPAPRKAKVSTWVVISGLCGALLGQFMQAVRFNIPAESGGWTKSSQLVEAAPEWRKLRPILAFRDASGRNGWYINVRLYLEAKDGSFPRSVYADVKEEAVFSLRMGGTSAGPLRRTPPP